MKRAIIACLALGACATTGGVSATQATQKALYAARSAEAVACQEVLDLHEVHSLTGAKFNQAKSMCAQTHALLVEADHLLKLGKLVEADDKIDLASELLPLLLH